MRSSSREAPQFSQKLNLGLFSSPHFPHTRALTGLGGGGGGVLNAISGLFGFSFGVTFGVLMYSGSM